MIAPANTQIQNSESIEALPYRPGVWTSIGYKHLAGEPLSWQTNPPQMILQSLGPIAADEVSLCSLSPGHA